MKGMVSVAVGILFIITLLIIGLSIFFMVNSRLQMYALKSGEGIMTDVYRKYISAKFAARSATYSASISSSYLAGMTGKDQEQIFAERIREAERAISDALGVKAKADILSIGEVKWRIEIDAGDVVVNTTILAYYQPPPIPDEPKEAPLQVSRYEDDKNTYFTTGRISGSKAELEFIVARKGRKMKYAEFGNSSETYVVNMKKHKGPEVDCSSIPSWLGDRLICRDGRMYGCGFEGGFMSPTPHLLPAEIGRVGDMVCLHQGDKFIGKYWFEEA